MNEFHNRFRIFLLTFALGLASVTFFHYPSERWGEIPVDLPQVQSEIPFYIFPKQVLTKEDILSRKLISQDRLLSDYDFGGEYVDCTYKEQNELQKCKVNLAKARKFLFQHWQERKRAHIVATFFSCDNSSDVHIFIEPDENENWHIISISKSNRLFPAGANNLYAIEMKSVKLKKAMRDIYRWLDNGTKYLSFTDENGKEIMSL